MHQWWLSAGPEGEARAGAEAAAAAGASHVGAVAELLVLLRLLLRGVLLLCAELHTEVRVWGQGWLSKIAE